MSADRQVLEHILRYINDIEKANLDYNADFNVFTNNVMYKYGVSFCLFQIGELVGRLTDDFKDRTSKMPWNEIRGLRNIVAHDYNNVDDGILWETISIDIPALKAFCENELGEMK